MKKWIVVAVLLMAVAAWAAEPADLQKKLDNLLRQKRVSTIEMTKAEAALNALKAKDAELGLAIEDLQKEIRDAGFAIQQDQGVIKVVKPAPAKK